MKRTLIALVAHTINAAYCAALGDTSQPKWDDAPEWQRASALAGVDMHLANPDATPENSHESWLAQKLAEGWKYGPVKDAEKKEHPCCVPYAEIPPEQKAKDHLFRAVVHVLKDIQDAAAPAVAAAGPGFVLVKYVGRRETYIERAYGSGIVFVQGETKPVPVDLAAKLLRHADVYVPGEPGPFTEAVEVAQAPKQTQDESTQDLRDTIAFMDKDALETFAKTNFKIDLDKRKSVNTLRQHVTQLVDQYGAP